MKGLKKLFDFYINSSIHVALSVYSLVRMTQFLFRIQNDSATVYFAFFGTIVGYNFVKYDALARTQRLHMSFQLKVIATVSLFSLILTGYYFFQLQKRTQLIGVFFLITTLLYTFPFFPNTKNARNWAGIKIYIVALCWVGVTIVLPIINVQIPITSDFYLKGIQRFLLVFVLILIFEIIDLQNDDPHLKTVPQQIGVNPTKMLGVVLLFIFCLLEFFNTNTNDNFKIQLISFPLQVIVSIPVAAFLVFATPYRSKYYTSFWVESTPIFWWLMLMVFK